MSLTGESFYGYQVESGDSIIVDDEEITIREIVEDSDDGDIIAVRGYSNDKGDTDTYYLLADCRYEEWGY